MMLGSLGIGLSLTRTGVAATGDARPLQNIAARGQVHNGTAGTNGTKTRLKGIYRFTIAAGGAVEIAPVFANFWINNETAREAVPAAAYTIRKAAISYEGVTVPLMFGGQRSATVAPGTVGLQPDAVAPQQFGVAQFLPGHVAFVRMCLDIPAGQTVAAHLNAMYLGGESQLRYDPANEIDDIDANGWTEPADSDRWAVFPGPVMLVGRPASPVTSLVGLGDSILDGSVDNAGDGAAGGGWLRRAAYAESLPYLSISRTGDKAQFVAASNTRTKALIKLAGAHAAVVALGNNDIRDGRTYAQFLTDLRAVWTMLRSVGVRHVVQAQVMAETTSTNQNSSIAGQSVVPVFAAGGMRDQINATIAALDDGAIDDQIDIVSPVQSAGKWDVPTFATTLAAAATAWGGAISLNHAPEVGDFLSIEPETPANQDVNWPHVAAVAGAGPFTVTLTGGPTKAHAAGTAVKTSLSADGIHAQQPAHKRMALKAAPALRRLRTVKTPWLNAARSFEIDFVNRRAQVGGAIVPLLSLVSCVRASGGKAFDGLSWFDFGNDALRYVDGGGLFIEPARTNTVPRNTWSDAAAPSTVPSGWQLVTNGLSQTLDKFAESGMNVLRVRLYGTSTMAGSVVLRMPSGVIPAVPGQTWAVSFYARRLGANLTNDPNIQAAVEEMSASGGILVGTYQGIGRPKPFTRLTATRTISNGLAASVRPVLVLGSSLLTATAYDFTTDFAFPQMEQNASASSPIETTGTAATRQADVVTLTLPAGTHALTLTFDDGSTQVIAAASGVYSLNPTTLNRPIVKTIVGTKT